MSGQRGFTIIESLVALAVLAITVVALYEAIGTSFRTFDRAAKIEEAVLIAQSQLDRVVALRRLPDVRQGTVDDTAFAWQLSVVSAANARLATLRLTVTWPDRAEGIAIERLVLLEAAS
ncbi:MAG: type II secretion system protein [Alphaproteobacteria bacterium]|nr:type II secretion system protein [Alphaproteobacteria bacterium]